MTSRQFVLASALITLAAFVIREWFVLTMVVPQAIAGDVASYVRYALHLVWDGTFSQAMQGQPVTPDAFRSPGYPWLLAAILPQFEGAQLAHWYSRIYQVQVLLGTATVAGVIALARLWMPRGFALVAGGWMALQSHNIAATGTILSEVLFGACIVGGLLALAYAVQRKSVPLGALAGVLLGYAYLTNPVIAFLPFLLLPLCWKEARKPALAMVAIVTLAIGGWSIRNAIHDTKPNERADANFVQGSWPEYHALFKLPFLYPAKLQRMNHEMAVIQKDRRAGMALVFDRLAEEPKRYAQWYASKPYLLFDWEIRVGVGMIYTVTMIDTMLDSGPMLGLTTIQWYLNPLAFALAFCGLVLAFWRRGPALPVAIAVAYLTAVHFVFQAEPRYAIPYRSLEIMLAISAVAYLWGFLPSGDRAKAARGSIAEAGGIEAHGDGVTASPRASCSVEGAR